MTIRNLRLQFNTTNEFGVSHHSTGEQVRVSVRYGWSTHNCLCQNTSKTGLVLYPSNPDHKNIVLLLCEKCYEYRGSDHGIQHKQLADWYFGIYGDEKSFLFTSGFYKKVDGELGFNSSTFNSIRSCPYHTDDRTMGQLEQDVVRQVIQDKLDTYIVER
ncbi:unnamed protein product [Rotaria magnacalcarata]|uniref:Uncharacterized protein n=1 Tax=Rotaria magnacalcarata TaxID=392030 RepID=A0A8S3HDP7_9BILA|nr:unnamed protein product [Rotaria magnacalcarata]